MALSEQEVAKPFTALRGPLAKWGAFVDATVNNLLDTVFSDTNFIQMRPQHRCKDVDSYVKKVMYRSKNNNYPNPLVDVEDKVATRVVLLTTANVKKVVALLTSCEYWDNKISKDTNEVSLANPNLFDYQSVHVVVWPKENFEQTDNRFLTCEIQVRTLLQHAYAEVTHDSVYKGAQQNDGPIKRQLSKCMALMETTDDMFCSIFDKISLTADTEDYEYKKLLAAATAAYNQLTGQQVNYKKADLYFLDAVLSLYHQRPIGLDLFAHYVRTNEVDIQHALTGSSVLLKEPAVLILFCYIDTYDDFVIRHWPLSMHIVDAMRESLGISAGEY
jgi:ppGpp synthetase/RelA/SpoT-type nucleotidyltranferase